MTPSRLFRWTGLAGIVGGIAIASFVIEHPWDQLLGAAIAQTPAWRLAHGLHFVGAAFVLIGLVGLYVRQMDRLGRVGLAGFLLAFLGTAMFLGTGMITAFVWPMVAVQAPAAVEIGGAMFAPPAMQALAFTAMVVGVGYPLFGWASWRAGVLPRGGVVLLTVGAVLGVLPPHPLGPMPWALLVLGGVLFGAGSAWLGLFLRREASGAQRVAAPEP